MPTYVKQDGTADSKTIKDAIIAATADDNIVIIQDSNTYGTSSGGESDFSTGVGYAITTTVNHGFELKAEAGQTPRLNGNGCYGTFMNVSHKDDVIFKGLIFEQFGSSNGGMIGAENSEGLLVENCTIWALNYTTKLFHRADSDNANKPIIVRYCDFHNAATNYFQFTPKNVIVQDCIYIGTGSSYSTPMVRLQGAGCKAINVTAIAPNQRHTIIQVSASYNCVAITTREFGANFGEAFDVDEAHHCVAFHGNSEFSVTGDVINCVEVFTDGGTYGDLFEDFSGSNFFPSQTGDSYLYNTGLTTGSGVDLSGSNRAAPYDIGAYEVCSFWTGFTDDTQQKFAEDFVINKANNGRQELSRRAGCSDSVINRPPAGATIRGSWSLRNRKRPYLATQGSQTPDDITN